MKTLLILILLLLSLGKISGQSYKGNVWIVAVNIYQYQNSGILSNLDYSSSGAYEFAQLYDSRQLTLVSPDILVNRRATRESVLESLTNSFVLNPKLTSEDLIIFYFSGHGGMAGDQIGICPYDYSGDVRDLITDSDILGILEKSKAKHKICFLEACKSKVVSQDIYNPNIIDDFNESRKNIRAGLAFVTSSEVGKETYGMAGESGYFTKYLLKGLKGECDVNKDKIVTISELFTFIQSGVKEASKGNQSPQINTGGFDSNMPVIIIPGVMVSGNEPPPVQIDKKPCEINQVGDVCIFNNSQYPYLYIVVNDKVLSIKSGEQECYYDVPVGIFKFKAREDQPGGGSYCLGCFNSDFEVRIEACKSVTKRIN